MENRIFPKSLGPSFWALLGPFWPEPGPPDPGIGRPVSFGADPYQYRPNPMDVDPFPSIFWFLPGRTRQFSTSVLVGRFGIRTTRGLSRTLLFVGDARRALMRACASRGNELL